jgi:hypothetical protein
MSTRTITERLARASAGRPRLVIGAWALGVLAAAAVIAALLGSALTTNDDFTGHPESQRAEQLLQRAFPPVQARDGFRVDEAVIVSSARLRASDAGFQRRLETLAADLRSTGGARVDTGPVSDDGRSALLLVQLRGDVEPVVRRVVAADGQWCALLGEGRQHRPAARDVVRRSALANVLPCGTAPRSTQSCEPFDINDVGADCSF